MKGENGMTEAQKKAVEVQKEIEWQIYGKQKETYSQRNETEVG